MSLWRRASRRLHLDAEASSARTARDVVRGVCADAAVPESTADTVMLLVSEVVTNAVAHCDAGPVLDVDVQPEVLRVTVTDDAAGTPRLRRQVSALATSGRGLLLVDTLAARWGIERRVPVGKAVWFELEPA